MKLTEELDKYFKSIKEEEELEEMNTTAAVPGDIKTPHMFTGGKSKFEKKRKKSATTSTGNRIVKKTSKHIKQESSYKKMIKKMMGIHEISYREYKKDPTSTPQQKVNRGIMEVNKMLG